LSIEAIGIERRLPRLGKIRLGIMKKGRGGSEYPSATDHFVFDEQVPELAELFGDNCREIDGVMIPSEIEHNWLKTSRSAYSRSGLFCRSYDAEKATRTNMGLNDKGKPRDPQGHAFLEEQGQDVEPGMMYDLPCLADECPYYAQKKCKKLGRIMFFILKSPRFGVYEISTTSINSIRNVYSAAEAIKETAGRITGIPLSIILQPLAVQPEGKKKTVFVLNLEFKSGGVGKLLEVAATAPGTKLIGAPEQVDDTPDDLYPHGGGDLGADLGEEPAAGAEPTIEDPANIFATGGDDEPHPSESPEAEERAAQIADAAAAGHQNAARQEGRPAHGSQRRRSQPPPEEPEGAPPGAEDFWNF
jgi:hypothetical protein